MSGQPVARVLIVDDEAAQTTALCSTLRAGNYAAIGYTSPREALTALSAGKFDLLLTDLSMPEMDGIDLLRRARAVDPELTGIIMTGHGTIDSAVRAMQEGALDYIQKPFALNVVLAVLGRALEVRRLRLDNARLRRLEREHIHELEMANRDLEAFAASVSHDLRAPLRAIMGFSSELVSDHDTALAEPGRMLLTRVLKSGARMERLIDDLLRFCRSGREALRKETVDLNALVRNVSAELHAKLGERAVDLRIGDLPCCQGDASLLEQVFVNLLSNAFKFTKNCACPEVEVGSFQHEGIPVVFVRDNGAGFDMKHAGSLFGVFQRLHSDQEFEGTGVGLSIVRRIIERHGGRIWARSAPGEGATFMFTLADCRCDPA